MNDTCYAETVIVHRNIGYQRICDYMLGHDGPHEWEEEQ